MRTIVAVVALTLSGCCHNLQGPYVAQMEDTHAAIMLDVKAKLYTPDEAATATLEAWDRSNKQAREVLEAE